MTNQMEKIDLAYTVANTAIVESSQEAFGFSPNHKDAKDALRHLKNNCRVHSVRVELGVQTGRAAILGAGENNEFGTSDPDKLIRFGAPQNPKLCNGPDPKDPELNCRTTISVNTCVTFYTNLENGEALDSVLKIEEGKKSEEAQPTRLNLDDIASPNIKAVRTGILTQLKEPGTYGEPIQKYYDLI